MQHLHPDLFNLLTLAKQQGRLLTYDQIGDFLPDEDTSSSLLSDLLLAMDQYKITVVEELNLDDDDFEDPRPELPADADPAASLPAEEQPKLSDDPIRMYLSQMSHIPLLSREEEIAYAKKIEVSRKRFRRLLLTNAFAMQATLEDMASRCHGDEGPDCAILEDLAGGAR